MSDVQGQLDQLEWYHSIDVDGATTRGWFDLRHALDRIPFPDVRGKRCLDVGTWDGFYAFELERRGAREVVALDLPDLSGLDYPPEVRADPDFDPLGSDRQRRSAGFEVLQDLLASSVRWCPGNIYDIDPSNLGTFDVVVVGSLLVHLRDPIRALDAVRRVTDGFFLSIDYVHPRLNLPLVRNRPRYELRGGSSDFQWWLPNDAGLRHLLHVGGFEIDRSSPYFLLRPGAGQNGSLQDRGVRGAGRRALHLAFAREGTRGGHLHRAHLTHPRF